MDEMHQAIMCSGRCHASGDNRQPAHSSCAQEASGTDVHFVVWVIWILITVFIDIFRLHDLPGWTKALRFLFVLSSRLHSVAGIAAGEASL
jgi:hypothetical protein